MAYYDGIDIDEDQSKPYYAFSSDREYPKEEGYYQELLGKFQACPDIDKTTFDPSHWDEFNAVMQALIELGHTDYERLKITPVRNGNRISFISYATLRMKIMAAIRKMHQDFRFTDPNYLLYQHSPKNAPSFHNTNENNQSNNQSQIVDQEIEVNVSIEQKFARLENEIKGRLDEEQRAQIEPLLKNFKKEPQDWVNGKKLILAVLGFGKDIATNLIASILAFYILPPTR